MRTVLAALVAACFGCGATPRSPHRHVESATLFRGVAVFDGIALTPDRDVLIAGDRIVEVARHIDASGATVIDGTGKTLVPGLIDAHAHVYEAEQLREAAVFGVTTVLDMLTAPDAAQEVKRQLAKPEGRQLADLRSAGNAVTAPGGHGTEYGVRLRTIERPDDAAAFIDACVAEGSDYIKIIYDDGSTYGIHFENISKETMAAAIAAAHARKLLAVAHIGSQQGAKDAIESGVDGLAHLFVDSAPDADFVALAAKSGAFVVPTLSVNSSITGKSPGDAVAGDPDLAPYLSAESAANLAQMLSARARTSPSYAFAEQTVKKLRDAHVPILAGTDAPNPGTAHGASMHGELELLVRAGLTPAEALAAATSVPAAKFQLGDRGRIAGGFRADLVLVDGDPTADIRSLRRITGVWVRGVPIRRKEYRDAIEDKRARGEQAKSAPGSSNGGVVSDFERGDPSASFGAGWTISTDEIMGGKSRAEMKIAAGGAADSKGSLAISGEIDAGSRNAWAGAMFSPGEKPLAPANLSGSNEIAFWAKGDGRTYAIMLFSQSRGAMPAFQLFDAGSEWKQYTFALSSFHGIDASELTGVFFGAAGQPGTFAFQIDDVELR